jgi:hypothetical protein
VAADPNVSLICVDPYGFLPLLMPRPIESTVGKYVYSERPLYVTDKNVQKLHHTKQELQVANKILATIKKSFEYN